MESKMKNIDQQIYIFVVNTIGFLKTLQKKQIKNKVTSDLSFQTKNFSKKFNEFYEQKIDKDEIKRILIPLIEKLTQLLIENFEDYGKDIINEKADLYITIEKIKKEIQEL